MPEESAGRFADPHDYEVPAELEGWEEMYPSHHLFSQDRAEWEKAQFWYADKIHAPEPLPPLDLIFQEAWQIALSQYTTRVFCIPPAQGIAQRIVGCYLYICAIAPPPEDIIGEKAGHFEKRVFYVFEHYEELWDKWLTKFQALGNEMKSIEVPAELPKYGPDDQVLPAPTGVYVSYDLLESFDHLVNNMIKGWQYHFEMLNLTYLAYLMFADVARKLFPGISESAIGKMVAGAYVSMFRPEEELCRLSRMAHESSDVAQILKGSQPATDKINELSQSPDGKLWLEAYEKAKDPWFFVSCGSGWFHHEGSWIDTPEIPFGYIKSYVQRLERGETIERNLDGIDQQRDEIVAEYRNLITTDEDRESFDGAYNTIRTIYRYAEDHLFWVEHWFHTIWFDKVRQFGQLLVNNGMLNEVDDLFMFNRYEIPELLTELSTAWALGVDIPKRDAYYKAKAEKRKKILKAASDWNPSPALGVPPAEVAEPFTIMLWGGYHRQGSGMAQGRRCDGGRGCFRNQGLCIFRRGRGRTGPGVEAAQRYRGTPTGRDSGLPHHQSFLGAGVYQHQSRRHRYRGTYQPRRHRLPRIWYSIGNRHRRFHRSDQDRRYYPGGWRYGRRQYC